MTSLTSINFFKWRKLTSKTDFFFQITRILLLRLQKLLLILHTLLLPATILLLRFYKLLLLSILLLLRFYKLLLLSILLLLGFTRLLLGLPTLLRINPFFPFRQTLFSLPQILFHPSLRVTIGSAGILLQFEEIATSGYALLAMTGDFVFFISNL